MKEIARKLKSLLVERNSEREIKIFLKWHTQEQIKLLEELRPFIPDEGDGCDWDAYEEIQEVLEEIDSKLNKLKEKL